MLLYEFKFKSVKLLFFCIHFPPLSFLFSPTRPPSEFRQNDSEVSLSKRCTETTLGGAQATNQKSRPPVYLNRLNSHLRK
jgi:hypothetical protein